MSPTHAIPDARLSLEHAIDQDQVQHIEDDILVNAVRGGQLVQVYWSALTDDERRAAYDVMFHTGEW